MKPMINSRFLQWTTQLFLLVGLLWLLPDTAQAQAGAKAKRRLMKMEQKAQQTTQEEQNNPQQPVEEIKAPQRLANAQARQPNRPLELGKVPNQILDRVLLQLEITEPQRPQLIAVRRKYMIELPRLIKLLKAKQDVFDDAMNAIEFNPDDIERKADDLAKTQGDLLRTQTRQMIEIRKILTPEQFAKFHQLLEEERRKTIQQRMLNP
ncbi:MAG: hypothetical protein JST84_12265 [Acidobacteria bacterium]|nr:hypothetical protein [Acidobacteriota bacterium]